MAFDAVSKGPALVLAALVVLASDVVWAAGPVRADFNRDGFDDLAIGVPGEDIRDEAFNNVPDAGAVVVIYGSPAGLSATHILNQFWHQNVTGIADRSEADDHFGAALAAGDFNNDGFDDLAIGVPGEDDGAIVDAGAIHVLFGSLVGLSGYGNQMAFRRTLKIRYDTDTAKVVVAGEMFGAALAAGDFGGSRIQLVVGIPGAFREIRGTRTSGGIVTVTAGLYPDNFFCCIRGIDIAGGNGVGGQAGSALAVMDFDGDGRLDLIAGAPRADHDQFGLTDSGLVFVYTIDENGARVSATIMPIEPENGDLFGFALAAGDFDGNGRDDLAIGVPGEDIDLITNAGAVQVVYRYDDHREQVRYSPSNPRLGDEFGSALAAGNFNRRSPVDLAIGSPGRNLGGIAAAGAMSLRYGAPDTGLANTGPTWTQDTTDVLEVAEASDRFGFALAVGDFNGDRRDDLVVGVPGEDIFNLTTFRTSADAGVVHVIYGTASGLSAVGNQLWHQDKPDIVDGVESGDAFGAAVH